MQARNYEWMQKLRNVDVNLELNFFPCAEYVKTKYLHSSANSPIKTCVSQIPTDQSRHISFHHQTMLLWIDIMHFFATFMSTLKEKRNFLAWTEPSWCLPQKRKLLIQARNFESYILDYSPICTRCKPNSYWLMPHHIWII